MVSHGGSTKVLFNRVAGQWGSHRVGQGGWLGPR